MAYLNKHVVLASIKRRVQHYNDENYTIFEAYLGVNPITRKPVRKAAKSIEKLRRIISDFYARLSAGGDASVLLNAYQAMDAGNALNLLKEAGMHITLTECVRRIIERSDEPLESSVTVSSAYKEYLAAQRDKSSDHQAAVRSRVGRWAHLFGGDRPLSDVTAKEVGNDLEERLLDDKRPKSKTTYNNHLGYIKTFLAWCAAPERGYIKENPLVTMKPKVKGYVDPEYMKSADVEKLFRVLERRGGPDLADAILSFFCGMRQAEIQRVSEGEQSVVIDLDEKYIRIIKVKGHLRGVKPRAFTIPPQALAWMKSMPDFVSAARRFNKKFRDGLKSAAAEADVSLPENAGRHTFCTMFEAAHHDSNALSAIVGNTEDVRDRHYNGVAKPQEGRDYFAILPKEINHTK